MFNLFIFGVIKNSKEKYQIIFFVTKKSTLIDSTNHRNIKINEYVVQSTSFSVCILVTRTNIKDKYFNASRIILLRSRWRKNIVNYATIVKLVRLANLLIRVHCRILFFKRKLSILNNLN